MIQINFYLQYYRMQYYRYTLVRFLYTDTRCYFVTNNSDINVTHIQIYVILINNI